MLKQRAVEESAPEIRWKKGVHYFRENNYLPPLADLN